MPETAKVEIKDIAGSVALVCALFGLAVYLPILGFFFALFIPLPVLYYQIKLGRTHGMIASAISAVAVFIMIGSIGVDLIFFAELLFIGILLSVFFEKNLPVEMVVGLTCLAVLGSGAAGLIFYSFTLNQSIGSIVSAYVMRNLELTMALYQSAGIPEDNVRVLSDSLGQIQYVLVRITPALITSMTMLVVWANILTARPIFSVRGMPYPSFGRLNQWRAPELLVWLVIGCGGALLLPSSGLKIVGMNGLIVFLTIYFFQGIAVVSFFFDKKHFSRIARILLYGLIVLQQLLLIVVIGLGFFDTWIDFRKLDKNTE